MKKNRIIVTAVSLLLIVTTLLAGCGTSAQTAGSSAGTNPQKPIELTFYYPVAVGGPVTKIIDQMAADFTKENPNIKVNPVYTGSYAETRTKVQTAIQGNKAPDLAIMFSTDLYSLLDMDAIVDMDQFIKTDEDKAYLADFYPGFMTNSQTQDKTWGIPFQRSTIILYYNKDAFKEVGLDPEKPPATWEEMVSDAKKLTKDGRWGLEIPSTDYAYWMLQTFTLQQNGKNLMNTDGNEVYFNSPEAQKGLQFWLDLSKVQKVMPGNTIAWATVPTDFLEGKTAMMYHTTGNLTNIKKSAKFNFGTAMLPAMDTRGTPTGGGNFYIFKNSSPEKQQAAWKFIRWMTTPERVAQWSIDTGYVATRKQAYETDTMKKYIKDFPYALTARDQLQYAAAELSTHENGKVTKIMEDTIQAVLTQQKPVQQALDDAQKNADTVLNPFKK
ncbi:ABC transporter substrate-binding protein [Desulfosporosinus sp. FKA]|uniref:ABC transporter substrate-binding protein n=1 Tax=Desulfosporosinus sp. FKA TaxID=1969834 RepID=UPI000B4A2507|nr:ABC transporter substrate-binding protein [Desulfosporosinus sp. FKA]